MKTIVGTLFVLLSGFVMAQPPANATVYDCNSNSKNIYNTLGTGKSIIVASKGFDCSICMNSAPAVQTWALQNKTKVEVWGAMTFTYNNNTPTCANISSWRSSYGWNDVFMFIDSSKAWFQNGTPKYITYSAIDSSILYQGSNFTTARNFAIGASTVGISPIKGIDQANIYASNGLLVLTNLPSSINQLKVYDLTGKLIVAQQITSNSLQLNINQTEGIYVLRLISTEGNTHQQKVYLGN